MPSSSFLIWMSCLSVVIIHNEEMTVQCSYIMVCGRRGADASFMTESPSTLGGCLSVVGIHDEDILFV